MGRTHIIQYRPLPLRDWIHDHQRLVRSSLGLIIAILVVAIAAPTISMVQAAIAEHTEFSAEGAEVISTTALPREWQWELPGVRYEHMWRRGSFDVPRHREWIRGDGQR